MMYLRAGLYAEGSNDYDFLLPLLDRILRDIAAELFPGANEVENTIPIDSSGSEHKRADRIAAAVREHEDLIDLLIIHADGDSDPEAALRERVTPGIEAARTAIPGKPKSEAPSSVRLHTVRRASTFRRAPPLVRFRGVRGVPRRVRS